MLTYLLLRGVQATFCVVFHPHVFYHLPPAEDIRAPSINHRACVSAGYKLFVVLILTLATHEHV